MKLQVPFVQLPLRFDAERLAAEMHALGEDAWRPHPQKYPGNFALPLISVDGDPDSDAIAGPMRPTEYLQRCPCLQQVLARIGGVWGRSRLMKLEPQAEVSTHADNNYYWRERLRVHVPILTHPDVRFLCGNAEVNMAAGECWVFDTWRQHRVINAQPRPRVHLVADTVGGESFWSLMKTGRVPGQPAAGWRAQAVSFDPSMADTKLLLESHNLPQVMTPWELRHHLSFFVSETLPHPRLATVAQHISELLAAWQSLWAQFGESREGWNAYRAQLDAFAAVMQQYSAGMQMVNGMGWMGTLRAMVLNHALADRRTTAAPPNENLAGESAPAPIASAGRSGRDPEFDRPVFIVSSPRSGSTLLFETLERAPGLYSTGRESHRLIEDIPELRDAMDGSDSNRLDADAATPSAVAELRRRFRADLHDRDGLLPSRLPLRLLEKTPKNALRIPFLAKAFPEARFVYLHRDVRQTLSSMIEAWQSGRFVTYPQLPGWQGHPWSLLLIPGWRELIGKSLPEIVAAQWRTATRVMLDDLSALPPEHFVAIDYDAFVADPQDRVAALCAWLDLEWDQQLTPDLPRARYTISAPAPGKWRRHQREIEEVLPGLQIEITRARRVLETHALPMPIEVAVRN